MYFEIYCKRPSLFAFFKFWCEDRIWGDGGVKIERATKMGLCIEHFKVWIKLIMQTVPPKSKIYLVKNIIVNYEHTSERCPHMVIITREIAIVISFLFSFFCELQIYFTPLINVIQLKALRLLKVILERK